MIFCKQDDRPARIARCHHDVLQHIARIGFCIDDDHVGLQLCDAIRLMHIRGEYRDDVIAGFQQADAQRTRTLSLHPGIFILLVAFRRHDTIDDDNS